MFLIFYQINEIFFKKNIVYRTFLIYQSYDRHIIFLKLISMNFFKHTFSEDI